MFPLSPYIVIGRLVRQLVPHVNLYRATVFVLFVLSSLITLQNQVALGSRFNSDVSTTYPNEGLVAYYSFDGNTNDIINSNHAQITGNGIYYINGIHGNAVKFGGYTVDPAAKLSVPTSHTLEFSNAASFSMWLRLDSDAGQNNTCEGGISAGMPHVLIGKHNDRYGLMIAAQFQNGETAILSGISSDGQLGFESGNIASINKPLGEWIHVAQVFDSNGAKLYLNGTLSYHDRRVPDFSLVNSRTLYFGLGSGEGSCLDWWYPLNGALDEVRIYNRTLTAAEIQSLYQYPIEPTPTETFTPTPSLTHTPVPTNTPTNTTTCSTMLCNGDFADGFRYWSSTENAEIVAGRHGQGIQLTYDGGNSDIAQNLRGTFQAGKIYQASTWCKADPGVACRIFFGDADSGYENSASKILYGTGEWQHITAIVKPNKDEDMSLWLYSQTPNSVAIYDDVEVMELTCPAEQICNGDFEQGMNYWQMDSGSSIAKPAYQGEYALRSIQRRNAGDPVWAGIGQTFEVTPGREYEISAVLKWDFAASVHMKVEWFDATGNQLNWQPIFSDSTSHTDGWVTKTGKLTAPSNAQTASLIIWHGVADGQNIENSTIWLDDVVVRSSGVTPKPPTPTFTPTPTQTPTPTDTPTPTSVVPGHIYIDTHVVAPGASVTIPVIGSFVGEKAGAVAVDVYYDSNLLTVVECTADPNHLFDGGVCNANYVDGEGDRSTIRFNLISGEGFVGTTELANLSFVVTGSHGQDTSVTASVRTLSKPDGSPIVTRTSDGLIQIRNEPSTVTPTPTITDTPIRNPTLTPTVTATNTPIAAQTMTPTSTPTSTGTPAITIIGDTSGAPGSHFIVQGTNFTPNSSVSLYVNAIYVSNVPVDANGSFTAVLLTTTETPAGTYQVSTGEAEASARFVVDADGEIILPTGTVTPVPVPSGNDRIFLPVIVR